LGQAALHPRSLAYIPSLDGIRAFAVTIVLLYHARAAFDGTLLAPLVHCGWVGVDLFFTLSGFLITRILISSDERPGYFRNFYIKRALRIWPLYYTLVLVAFLVSGFGRHTRPDSWWPYLTLTQNLFVAAFGLEVLRVTWSLAIEEQFYLAWPICIRLAGAKWLPAACAVLLVAEPFARSEYLAKHNSLEMYLRTFTHLDGIVFGSLLALILMWPGLGKERLKPWFWLALVAGIAGTIMTIAPTAAGDQHSIFLFSFLGLASAGLIGLCVVAAFPLAFLLELRLVRYLGRISYGVYLMHIPLFDLMDRSLGRFHLPMMALLACKLLGTIILASASWHFFESRLIALGPRWTSKRS
jgi:peptidoglycan/LPS O-acetylase OafA/YrhL